MLLQHEQLQRQQLQKSFQKQKPNQKGTNSQQLLQESQNLQKSQQNPTFVNQNYRILGNYTYFIEIPTKTEHQFIQFSNLAINAYTSSNKLEALPIKCRWTRKSKYMETIIQGLTSNTYQCSSEDVNFTIIAEIFVQEDEQYQGQEVKVEFGPIHLDQGIRNEIEHISSMGGSKFQVDFLENPQNQINMKKQTGYIVLTPDQLRIQKQDKTYLKLRYSLDSIPSYCDYFDHSKLKFKFSNQEEFQQLKEFLEEKKSAYNSNNSSFNLNNNNNTLNNSIHYKQTQNLFFEVQFTSRKLKDIFNLSYKMFAYKTYITNNKLLHILQVNYDQQQQIKLRTSITNQIQSEEYIQQEFNKNLASTYFDLNHTLIQQIEQISQQNKELKTEKQQNEREIIRLEEELKETIKSYTKIINVQNHQNNTNINNSQDFKQDNDDMIQSYQKLILKHQQISQENKMLQTLLKENQNQEKPIYQDSNNLSRDNSLLDDIQMNKHQNLYNNTPNILQTPITPRNEQDQYKDIRITELQTALNQSKSIMDQLKDQIADLEQKQRQQRVMSSRIDSISNKKSPTSPKLFQSNQNYYSVQSENLNFYPSNTNNNSNNNIVQHLDFDMNSNNNEQNQNQQELKLQVETLQNQLQKAQIKIDSLNERYLIEKEKNLQNQQQNSQNSSFSQNNKSNNSSFFNQNNEIQQENEEIQEQKKHQTPQINKKLEEQNQNLQTELTKYRNQLEKYENLDQQITKLEAQNLDLKKEVFKRDKQTEENTILKKKNQEQEKQLKLNEQSLIYYSKFGSPSENQKKMQDIQHQNDRFVQTIKYLQGKQIQPNGSNDELIRNYDKQYQENQQLLKQIQSQQCTILDQQQTIEEFKLKLNQQMIQNLENELQNNQGEIQDLKNSNMQSLSDSLSNISIIEDNNKENQQQVLNHLEKQNTVYRKELQQLKKVNDKLIEENQNLNKQLQNNQLNMSNSSVNYTQVLESSYFQQILQEKDQQIQDLQQEIVKLSKQPQNLTPIKENQNPFLKQNNNNILDSNQKNNINNNEINNTVSSQYKQNQENKKQQKKLENQNQILIEENQFLSEKVKQLQEELHTITHNSSQILDSTYYQDLEKEKNNLKKQVLELEIQLQKQQKEQLNIQKRLEITNKNLLEENQFLNEQLKNKQSLNSSLISLDQSQILDSSIYKQVNNEKNTLKQQILDLETQNNKHVKIQKKLELTNKNLLEENQFLNEQLKNQKSLNFSVISLDQSQILDSTVYKQLDIEKQQLKQQILDLESQINKHIKTQKKLELTNKNLAEENMYLQNMQNQKNLQDISLSESQIMDTTFYDTLQKEKQDQKNQIRQLEQENHKIQKESQLQIKKLQNTNKNLIEEMQILNNQIQELQDRSITSSQILDSSYVQTLDNQKFDLQKTITEQNLQYEKKNKEQQQLITKLQIQNKNNSEEIQFLQQKLENEQKNNEIDNNQELIQQLNSEKQSLRKENIDYQQKNKEQEKIINQLKLTNQNFVEQNLYLNEKLQKIEEELQEKYVNQSSILDQSLVVNQLTEKNQQIKTLQNQIIALQNENKEKSSIQNSFLKDKPQIMGSPQSAVQQIMELQKKDEKIKDLQMKIEKLETITKIDKSFDSDIQNNDQIINFLQMEKKDNRIEEMQIKISQQDQLIEKLEKNLKFYEKQQQQQLQQMQQQSQLIQQQNSLQNNNQLLQNEQKYLNQISQLNEQILKQQKINSVTQQQLQQSNNTVDQQIRIYQKITQILNIEQNYSSQSQFLNQSQSFLESDLLQQYQDLPDQIQKKFNDYQQETQNLQIMLQKTQTEIQTFQIEQQNQLSQQNQNTNQLQKENENQKQQIQKFEQQIQNLSLQNCQTMQALNLISEQVEKILNPETYKEDNTNNQENILDLSISSMNSSFMSETHHNSELSNTLQNLQVQTDLNQNLVLLEKKLLKFKQKLQEKILNINEQKQKLQILEQNNQQQQQQNQESLQQQQLIQNTLIQDLKKQIQDQKEQNQKLKLQNQEQQQKLAQKQQEFDEQQVNSQKQLKIEQDKSKLLNTKLLEQMKQLKSLKTENTQNLELNQKIENLNQKLKEKEQITEKMLQSNQNLLQENQFLQSQINALQEQLDDQFSVGDSSFSSVSQHNTSHINNISDENLKNSVINKSFNNSNK